MLNLQYPNMHALLADIRQRPGMFLGHATITGLHLLLSGIDFAEDYHRLPVENRIGGFDRVGFEQWVDAQYNPERLSLNSFSLAKHVAGTEEAGFELWFLWFDEFVE